MRATEISATDWPPTVPLSPFTYGHRRERPPQRVAEVGAPTCESGGGTDASQHRRPTAPTPNRCARSVARGPLRSSAAVGRAGQQRRRGAPRRRRDRFRWSSSTASSRVNVRGVFAAIQRAVPHHRRQPAPDHRQVGSINADRVPGPGLSVYAMTKGAVAGLTRGLARELGPTAGSPSTNVQYRDRSRPT